MADSTTNNMPQQGGAQVPQSTTNAGTGEVLYLGMSLTRLFHRL